MSSFLISVHPSIITTPLAFEFWRGEAPQFVREHLQQFTKPGKDGHGERKLGAWGVPITCQLESHWPSYAQALAAMQIYNRVIGSGVVQVVYNNVPFSAAGIGFTVQDIALESDTHSRILQIGPDYAYSGAGILRTRWQMTAINVGS